jgi:hypothetical protein
MTTPSPSKTKDVLPNYGDGKFTWPGEASRCANLNFLKRCPKLPVWERRRWRNSGLTKPFDGCSWPKADIEADNGQINRRCFLIERAISVSYLDHKLKSSTYTCAFAQSGCRLHLQDRPNIRMRARRPLIFSLNCDGVNRRSSSEIVDHEPRINIRSLLCHAARNGKRASRL